MFEIILPEAVMFVGVSLERFAHFAQNMVSLSSGLLVFITCQCRLCAKVCSLQRFCNVCGTVPMKNAFTLERFVHFCLSENIKHASLSNGLRVFVRS